MADFNPDEFLAATAPKKAGGAGGFDPDQFLQETSPGAPKQLKTDGGDAWVRGAASGASAGFVDRLSGAAEALGSTVGLRGLGGPMDEIHRANPNEALEGFGDAYITGRDAARRRYAETEAEHPKTFLAAQLAGGMAVPIPGGAATSLPGAVLQGAGMGAVAGAGNAKDITDMPEEALRGAGWGAGAGVAGKAIGALVDKLRPAKFGSVMLNTPEEALQHYIDAGGAAGVAGPSRRELAQSFPSIMDQLKHETIEGSKASRAILDAEGNTVKGSQISDILSGTAKDIRARLAGINDDPEKQAAAGWLEHMAGEYAPKPGKAAEASGLLDEFGRPLMGEASPAIDRELPTNRVKDFLQSLDKQTEWETAPGKFTRMDDGAKRQVRSTVDSLLKDQSPAYAGQMKKVASDAALLNQVANDTGNGSIQGFDNLFKRVQKDRNFDATKSIGELDQRMGTNYLKDLKNAEVREAMDKSYTNGSRAVNLYKEMGGKNPVARAAMGAVGATVDKYGAPMARTMVDKTAQIKAWLGDSRTVEKLGPYAKVLSEALQKGNQSLAAAHFVLSQTDPKYNDLMNSDLGGP